MALSIPERFLSPFVFAGQIFDFLDFRWDRSKFQREIKSPEFLEKYEQNYLMLGNQKEDRIGNHFGVHFVVCEDNKISEYGSGEKIYLKKCLKNYKIFTDPHRFYYLPEGIIREGKIFSEFHEIMGFHSIEFKNSESSYFKNCNFNLIECKYNVSINIYEKIKNFGTKKFSFKNLRLGHLENKHILDFHFQRGTGDFLLITNKEKYFQNFFECKNKENGCLISYSKKSLLENHEKTCKKIEEIYETPEILQKEIKNFDILIEKAQRSGLLEKFPKNDNFIFFDIESVLPVSTYNTKKMRILSHHKLVSIAANSFINGKHTSKVWVVKDNKFSSETQIVSEFLDFCFEALDKIENDTSLESMFTFLENVRLDQKEFELEEISNLRQIFFPFKDLPIFGYNNSRYDNTVIFEHIIKVLDERNIKTSEIQLLKKGPHYFSLKFLNLHFKDLINFSIPASLDKYLKTWAPNSAKLAYPYEKFSSIDEIRACLEFPEINEFSSTLKGSIEVDLFQKCKKIYDYHHNLPNEDPQYWPNFESYLKFYNLSDVEPASLALLKQFDTYNKNFGLSPMQYLGLPSFAKAAMLKMYDRKCPSMFTFPPNSEATKIFRTQLIGGLCNAYIRHITTDLTETAAKSAKYNKNGKKWAEIQFFDINAQYPSTFRQKFPCGLGFEWTNLGGILSKKLMTSKKISLGSVEWLDYMNQTDSRLKKSNGKRMQIISGWGSSEVKIGPYKVDGFSKVDEKVLIYEYDGCFFHGCDSCSKLGLTKNDQERAQFLSQIKNVEIIRMQECVWKKMKKNLVWKSKISKIINFRKVPEVNFINHLKNNDLYGFALVNIRSTEKAKKFIELNWPPLFFKAEINFEDIPLWMQENTFPQNFPKTTVVQGMFHENILVHTELLKFYVENGFDVISVSKFFEYQGAKCLKIIHDKVYKARVEATKTDDKMKSTAVKLVSNSMYGQMLMVRLFLS